MTASTPSVTTALGRASQSASTATAWNAVRVARRAGVGAAALRRAENVPGTIAAAATPRPSATAAALMS